MDKSPDAFRTISEVADALETPAHVLRFWETRFPQVRPVKRAGGRRYYRPSDVALLTGIKRLLHDDGLTIRGVQKILREQGVRHVSALGGEAGTQRDAPREPFDIIEDTSVDEASGPAAILPFASAGQTGATPDETVSSGRGDGKDLWPDAGVPPPDDDGTLVLSVQVSATAESSPAAARDLFDAGAEQTDATLEPVVAADAALDAVSPASADHDDLLIASVLQTATGTPDPAAVALSRSNDVWRSLPLAAGEEMPMAARLRALPRGALVPRSSEVAAWVLRARDLTRRMQKGGTGSTGGSAAL